MFKTLKNKEFKINVFAGIVSSLIFLVILNPIIDLLWSVINKTGSVFWKNYLDAIIMEVAKGKDSVVFSMFSLVLAIYIFTIFGFLFKRSTTEKRITHKNLKEKKDYSEIDQMQLTDEIRRGKILLRLINVIHIILYIVIIVWILNLITKNVFIFALNNEFQHKVTIITPYVTGQEVIELKSRWALMSEIRDYEEISKSINDIVQQEGINIR